MVPALIEQGEKTSASAYLDGFVEGIAHKPLLLDPIGPGPGLSWWRVKARVANPEFDAQVRPKVKNKRERLASDVRSTNTLFVYKKVICVVPQFVPQN